MFIYNLSHWSLFIMVILAYSTKDDIAKRLELGSKRKSPSQSPRSSDRSRRTLALGGSRSSGSEDDKQKKKKKRKKNREVKAPNDEKEVEEEREKNREQQQQKEKEDERKEDEKETRKNTEEGKDEPPKDEPLSGVPVNTNEASPPAAAGGISNACQLLAAAKSGKSDDEQE